MNGYFRPPDKTTWIEGRSAPYKSMPKGHPFRKLMEARDEMEKRFVFNDPQEIRQLVVADTVKQSYMPQEGAAEQSGVTPYQKSRAFEEELAQVINRHSRENGSNTPDFILAAYLVDCLENFDRIMLWRQKWYSPEGVPAAERINGPKPTEAEGEAAASRHGFHAACGTFHDLSICHVGAPAEAEGEETK